MSQIKQKMAFKKKTPGAGSVDLSATKAQTEPPHTPVASSRKQQAQQTQSELSQLQEQQRSVQPLRLTPAKQESANTALTIQNNPSFRELAAESVGQYPGAPRYFDVSPISQRSLLNEFTEESDDCRRPAEKRAPAQDASSKSPLSRLKENCSGNKKESTILKERQKNLNSLIDECLNKSRMIIQKGAGGLPANVPASAASTAKQYESYDYNNKQEAQVVVAKDNNVVDKIISIAKIKQHETSSLNDMFKSSLQRSRALIEKNSFTNIPPTPQQAPAKQQPQRTSEPTKESLSRPKQHKPASLSQHPARAKGTLTYEEGSYYEGQHINNKRYNLTPDGI